MTEGLFNYARVIIGSLGEEREKREASRRQLMSRLLMLVWREELRDCLVRGRRWGS